MARQITDSAVAQSEAWLDAVNPDDVPNGAINDREDLRRIGMALIAIETAEQDLVSAVADARGRIEQAKGVLMVAYGISAERAFDILVWRSQEENLKVRDVAGRFLDAVASKASAETQSHVDQALLTLG